MRTVYQSQRKNDREVFCWVKEKERGGQNRALSRKVKEAAVTAGPD